MYNIAENWRGAVCSDEHHGNLLAEGIIIRGSEQHENLNCGPKSKPGTTSVNSRRKRTPSIMLAYLATLAVVVSTASASSRSAAGSGGSGGSSRSRSPPADPRLSNSLRSEAASLASGKQMLNDGLSILGGATGGEYGEENSDADDDPLINGDDLALLDSIFGSSSSSSSSTPSTSSASAPSTSALAEDARLSDAVAYDEYDPIISAANDDRSDVGMDLVDDDEIDGLFERAGRLLDAEAEEGGEMERNFAEYSDYDEGGQYYDDDLRDEGQKAVQRPTMEDVLPEEEAQVDNSWEDQNDNLYDYDPYDEYLPVGGSGGANDDVFDADDQWETEYSQQVPGEDDRYDEPNVFEEEVYDINGVSAPPEFDDGLPAEEYDYVYDDQGQDDHQEGPDVLFDDNGGYDYEYDYTDPTLAMNDEEALFESVDEQELHENAGSQQMSGQEQEYEDQFQPAEIAGNFLEDQDDLEFDPAFADAAIAAARMEEEEEREFEAEVNADNTDNAADFDYIYEDRSLMFEFVDDEDASITDGTPKHPHHPVPPVHAADSTIDSIIRAHRIAVAKDLGIESPPDGASSLSSATSSSAVAGTQQRQAQPKGTHSQPQPSSNHPRSYDRSPGFGVSGNGGGGGPFDDPERNARLEARRQKNERNFRRETAADVHKTFSTAISSVIRGDASPHVPANLYGQTLEEERAGCKLAGLSPEFDRNGMRNGKFCSEEELQSYVEWSSLLQSTFGDQCGAVDIQTAKAKLYGGAQYHRSIRCFSALLLTLPLPEITEEELSLLLTASGSAGSGSHGAAGHDGPDLLRTAAILCRTKMEGLVRFALDELTGRVEYILRDRCWECIKYSALVRPASEAGTGAATSYGSGNGSNRRSRHDVGDEAAYKYADLEEIFKEVAAEAYTKFVKQSVSEAAQLGWTDALALLRYVSWDLTMPKPKPKRKNASSSSSRYGQSPSSDIKPIRGGAGGEAGLYSSDETIPASYAETSSKPNRQTEPYRAATPVRPVKQSQRLKARERRAKVAAEKAAKLRKEEEANQGFFSKVRLFRRTRRDNGAPLDADVSAYYDLNELYGLDDEFDGDGEMNNEDMGDLVGGVLSRGAVDDEGGVHSSVSSVAESPLESQMSSEVNEDGDDRYKLSRNQEMEDDEMLSILLRAAAVAASSNNGGMGESSFQTQTRAAMQALVQFVTDRWRRELSSLIIGKFNSFCLLGFHSEFGAYLRKEFEAKLVELEEEAKTKRRRR